MSEYLIIGGLALAVALGLLVNQRWEALRHSEHGLGISDLVTPITTLSAILLAFVLVEALASNDRARDQAGAEARIVEEAAEKAARIDDAATSQEYQGLLICYARAVRLVEWPSMAVDGHRTDEVNLWSGLLEQRLQTIRRAGGDDELDRLIDFDTDRTTARLARLAESQPSLPNGLTWLMFASVLVSVLGLALFMRRNGERSANIGALVIFTFFVGTTLVMIMSLDQPFTGLNKVEPSAIARTEAEMSIDLAAQFPGAPLPCDDAGAPTGTASAIR